ncbi:hemin ABC transporter permease [Oceanococcus atlanticus]|uniref:Hemin ABC transporter permease n=1 Tax=Oceanococcus atlanticus TaxID=1317117 RepID=A0A1Y1SB36_9GAMM|nr:iron ABC transporter permease [Oceanococcus atlanticus]ORE85842.1 hemin ABC transporter permease [Oceanococcus atlanticus]
MRRSAPLALGVLALASALAAIASLLTGPAGISPGDVLAALAGRATSGPDPVVVLWELRAPRTALTFVVGAVLALSGAVMQGLFRNPLADPSIIGVTSGASLGASLAIVFGASAGAYAQWLGLSVVAAGAFAGGLAASALVYMLATRSTGTSVMTMLLAGIAITALAGAINSTLDYFVDDDMLRRMSLWQMGGLDGANWARVGFAAVLLLPLMLVLPLHAQTLNAFLLGESEARHLGVAVEQVKRRLVILVALSVAASVALAGVIAFVGLVVPHMLRLWVGPDHRRLLPATLLGGGVLLLVADTLARVLVSPAEMPTGIVTALLGAPVFVWMLRNAPGVPR